MDLTLKEKILQTLLESSKSTGKIAKKLDYIDKNGNGKYNVVSPDLQKLETLGLIRSQKSERKTHGPPPTIYNIVYELPVIKKLLEKHPILIQDLQSNDTILSMLVEKHSWIFKLPIPIPEFEPIEDTPGPETQPPEHEFHDDKKARKSKPDKERNETYLFEAEENLKLKLKLSADFFKICILNEPDNLKNTFDEIFWQTKDGQLYEFIRGSLVEEQNINSRLFPPSPRNHPADNFYSKCSDIIFKSCVYHDILTGHKNAKATEYLKKMIKDKMLEEISTTAY